VARKSSRSRTGSGARPNRRRGNRDGEYWFDEGTADSACAFVEARCYHWQGDFAGKPFLLEDWQRDEVFRPLFGWKRIDPTRPREDWPRRYRTGYLEMGKGNGKTPIGAAVVVLLLAWDCEMGAEVYSAAGDREQASIVFDDTVGYVTQSPELRSRFRVLPGAKRIVDVSTRSFFKVLSSESSTKHGYKPHGIIFDELHVQKNRRLWSALRTGLSKTTRRQPLLLAITTAGEYDEDSLCYNEHEYAAAVIDGEVQDETHLAVVYAAEPEDDPANVATLQKANPNLGVSVREDTLRKDWTEALRKGPAAQAEYKQLHLCIWGESVECAIDMEKWKSPRCCREPLPEGPCYLGMDLSSKLDLTSVAAFFPDTFSVLIYFWIPEDNLLERKRRDVFDYPRYVDEGYITATPGNWVDQRAVRNQVVELADAYDVVEVGFDSWNATQMATWLQDDEGLTIVEMRQGTKTMSEPFKYVVGLVADEKLRHGGHPVLRWNARNLKARRDPNDNWAPKKDEKGRKRIDGMVALIMAIGRSILVEQEDEPGIWVVG
jgi:phage terminase large subunit-like protein